MEERLQKFLANAGIASRRKCEQYILDGRVSVNGIVVNQLGIKINPDKDEILLDNKKVSANDEKVYILLNKPIGYVTTSKEQFGRDKVLDLVKINKRVVPCRKIRYVHIRGYYFNERWRFCI